MGNSTSTPSTTSSQTTIPEITIPPTTTIPPITTPHVDADIIITEQNSIISLLQNKLKEMKGSLNIETFENIKPILLNSETYPDISDYAYIYNTNIALLDDPNNDIKNRFNTYIHLQDQKIKSLRKELDILQNNLQNSNTNDNDIKAFKSMDNSQILNVETYTSKNQNKGKRYPNYLIYGNHGCLQYEKSMKNKNNTITPATWSFQSCDATEPRQQFVTTQINDLTTYNDYITDPNNKNYILNNDSNITFGFNVVNPITALDDQCLQLNNDGISIMPCNLQYNQRFKTFYSNVVN